MQKRHHTTLCSNEPRSVEPTCDKVTEKASSGSSAAITGLLTPVSPCATLQTVTTYLLKTVVPPVIAGNNRTKANILFDEGAQRSFISIDMVKELGILPHSITDISLAWFGSASRHHQKLGVTTVEVKTDTGEQIPISAFIVPMIAAPIQNATPVTV